MMLQLNPTLPIARNLDNMKGYAIAIIDYSQEHDLLFVCAMDNGEIWTYNNKDIKIQNNISLNRIQNDILNTHPNDPKTTWSPICGIPTPTPFGTIPNGTQTNDSAIHFTTCSNWGNFMSGNPLNNLL